MSWGQPQASPWIMFQNVTLETMLLPLSWLQVSTLPKSCASASPSRLSQDEHTCYFGPRLLWHLRRIPKGLHQASHLIISLGLTAPWLSVFLFFPCLSLRSQQSTSWHRGPFQSRDIRWCVPWSSHNTETLLAYRLSGVTRSTCFGF